MAVAQQVPVGDNGAGAFLSTLFNNSGSLFGSGTTTTNETTAPLDLSQSNNVLSQVLQGTDPNTINDMMNGIFEKAKIALGPQINNSIAAGNRALTDTTLQSNQNYAIGTATAQAAQAKLDAIAKNNQIASTIVDSQVAGQARVAAANTTKTSTTSASPTGKLLQAAGIAATGYSALKKAKDAKTAETVASNSDFFKDAGPSAEANPATGTATADQAESFFNGTPDATPAGNFFDGTVGDSASAFSAGAETEGPALSSDALINTDDASAADILTPTADAGSDALAAGATDAGTDVLGAGAADLGGDAIVAGAGEAATDFGIGDAIVDAGTLTAVICTELMQQGLLDKALWNSCAWYRGDINTYTKIGYHYWAIPYVRLMKKSPLATKFIRPFAVGRYIYISGKWNLLGWFTCAVGEPICTLIGKIVTPNLLLDLPEK